MRIELTYGEYIEIGWAGANHDQLLLRTYTDDPTSSTTVQIAASYDGNRHNEVPELIRALEKFQAQDPTTPGKTP